MSDLINLIGINKIQGVFKIIIFLKQFSPNN